MAENSKIEWCHHTHNFWVGCAKVSPACVFCYAEGWAKRTGHPELWQGQRRRTTALNWRQPLKWDRQAAAAGEPVRVFANSLADFFDNQVPVEWRDDAWALIRATPNLTWMLLTKRPQNIAEMLPPDWSGGYPNVWLGITVENQEEANRRIPYLINSPARRRFLSCEPLLGPVDLTWVCLVPDGKVLPGVHFDALQGRRIDLVIAGGESGPSARPMHPAWVRSLRDQCMAAGKPFFFKQWGEYQPRAHGIDGWAVHWQAEPGQWVDGLSARDDTMIRVGKKAAGATLDGREWREMPA